jgi:hypothetical protein
MDGWRCRQIAENQAQGVVGSDFVIAVGDDEEDRKFTDAPAEKAEQLKRGSVGPVGILGDDDHRLRPRGKRREDVPEEAVSRVAIERLLDDPQAERGRQITYGTERTGGGEGVTRGAHDRRTLANAATERLGQRGLADTRLTSEEDDAPATSGHLSQVILKTREGGFALE